MRSPGYRHREVERAMTDRALFIAGLLSLIASIAVLTVADYPFAETPDWRVVSK